MVIHLYEYHLHKKGLILQIGPHFGEISPLPHFSRETFEEAKQETLAWIDTQKEPTLPSVRWGISCAQKPLRSLHLPLCSLGPKPHFPTAKLKLGHLPLDEAIHFVKHHLGKHQLRLDCNRNWTLSQALTFARHFKPTDFLYLEEPVQTLEELIAFSKITQFPIALDESIHSDWSLIPTLKAIVVKPMIVGEIPSVPPHLDLILSSSHETGLGLLHIAMQAANHHPLGLDTYRSDDLLLQPIRCTEGFFSWEYTSPFLNFKKLEEIR